MDDTTHDLSEREQAENLHHQALDLYQQRQYSACLALLDQALTLDQGNAYVYCTKGNVRYDLKDYQGAATEYLSALRVAPFYSEAMINLGNTYNLLQQYEQALKQYEHAMQIGSTNPHIHFNVANTLAESGRLTEALDAFSQAIEHTPEFGGAYLNRGNLLSRLGRHQEAMNDYHWAVLLAPQESSVVWTVTWAHFGSEPMTEEVANDLQRIARLEPEHYTSQCCFAVVALQRLDPQVALSHLEQAVQLDANQWDPHFWIGFASALQGETETAQLAIETSLDMGLPPLLLTPLHWLKTSCPDFFNQYAHRLLLRFGM